MAKSNTVTRTVTAKEAKKELKRIRKAARRGPLAPYRLAAALVLGFVVAGADLFGSLVEDPTVPALRFALAALLGWVMWGVIDWVLASTSRQMDLEERRAKRAARAEAQALAQAEAEAALQAQYQALSDADADPL